MSDIVIKDIPETVIQQLSSLGSQAGIGNEEFVRRLIYDAAADQSVEGGNEITIEQFQDSMEAYLRLAERKDLLITDEAGQRFVLISIDGYSPHF